MNNQILSKKMNIILEKMECSKSRFLQLCKHFDPAISKPTILNLINGTGKRLPSVETLSIVVKVCHTYGKGDLKRLTFDYLLSDEVNELSPDYLDSYHEFGLTKKTLDFFNMENTIGLFERDTMKGVNEFIPNIRICFFTQVSVANILVEILKLIKNLHDDSKDKNEIIARISGYLNTSYILPYLKQNKTLNIFIKDLEKDHTVEEIIKILFDIEGTLHNMYSSSKYYLIDSINEYYQKKEEDLYNWGDEPLTLEEQFSIDELKKKNKEFKEEDKRKSNIRRANKKKKELEEK